MSMHEAVIVSTARTPIGKAFRGAFNDTEAPVLGGHVIRAALDKAGVEGGDVGDVVLGVAAQQGTQGYNWEGCVHTRQACRSRSAAWRSTGCARRVS